MADEGSSSAQVQSTTMSAESLTVPQLQQQKQILEQEVTHLTDTVAKLKVAQQAYEMSYKALGQFSPETENEEILVPLANSVFVSGRAKNVKKVLLNIGTGYVVEVKTSTAKDHCFNKSNMLNANVGKFAKMLATKRSHLDTCMQLLQIKLQQQAGKR